MYIFMEKYTVNTSTIGYPKLYSGAEIVKVDYGNGSYACTMNSGYYVKQSIKNVKKHIKYDKMELNKNISDIN